MELDSMTFTRKTGFEEIISKNKTASVLDFWRWAFSDLVGNTERGTFAEYLVALACNVDKNIRISWNAYDLDLENGIKVEVKSSAYIQTWKQSKLSTPIFKINKTFSWDYVENKYDNVKKRHADIYVFALLSHQDKKTINPLDTNQWDFFIINK